MIFTIVDKYRKLTTKYMIKKSNIYNNSYLFHRKHLHFLSFLVLFFSCVFPQYQRFIINRCFCGVVSWVLIDFISK